VPAHPNPPTETLESAAALPNSTLSSPERAAAPGALIYCCWADGVEWNGGPAGVGCKQDEGAALRCICSVGILAVLLCIRSPRYYRAALSFLHSHSRCLPPCVRLSVFWVPVS
jgi:hypothetical protein